MTELQEVSGVSQGTAALICEIPGNKILEINEHAGTLFGFTRKEFQNLTLDDLIQDEDAPGNSSTVVRAVPGKGEPFQVTIEETIINLKGEAYNLVQINKPAGDKDLFFHSGEDLHYHFQNNPLGHLIFNSDFKLLSASEKITEWLGYKTKELIGLHVEELMERFIPEHKRKKALKKVREVKDQKITQSALSTRIFDKDGEARYVKFYNSVHFDSEGNMISVYCLVENLSEKIDQEQSIKLATEGGDIGFWILYPKENRVEFNEEWLNKSLGYDKDEIDYDFNSWSNLIHPQDFDLLIRYSEKCLKGEIPVLEIEFRMKTKKGTWKWFLSRARVTDTDSDGNPSKLSGIQLNIDEKKLTQLALADERDKFKLIAENSTDMISRHYPDGTYLYASPSSKQILGYSPEELLGRSAFDFFHPDDLKSIENNYKILLDSAEHEAIIYRQQNKSGTYKWVETTAKPIRNAKTGEIVEFQASTRDITEREKLHEKLREEKKFTNIIIDSLPGIFYMIDENQRYVLWNRNVEKVLECSSEDIKNAHPLDFYKPGDHEYILSKISEVMETGQANAEIDLVSKRGTTCRYLITGKKIEIGGKIYVLGSGIDVSEKTRALRTLQRNERLLIQLFENAPVSIATINKEGIIMNMNKSFENTFSYSAGEAVGANIDDLIVPEHLKIGQEEIIIKQDSSDKSALHFESIRLDKYGNQIPVMIGSIPVYIEEELISSYIIYVDISDQKLYEKQIEKSLQEKNVLLQEIHHRVKNNLAIVSGLISLQKYKLENEELHQILTDCELRIKSIALIHEKLYDTANFSNVHFTDYLNNLLTSVQQAMNSNNDVEFHVTCKTVQLNINQAIPSALILNELLSNSFKYAFEGIADKKIFIDIKENGKRINFSVRDNGIGIGPDFDPETSTTMGYSIITTLIDQLEADLTITSRNGTEVTYSFEKKNVSGAGGNLI